MWRVLLDLRLELLQRDGTNGRIQVKSVKRLFWDSGGEWNVSVVWKGQEAEWDEVFV